jgi:hypothetical protein
MGATSTIIKAPTGQLHLKSLDKSENGFDEGTSGTSDFSGIADIPDPALYTSEDSRAGSSRALGSCTSLGVQLPSHGPGTG